MLCSVIVGAGAAGCVLASKLTEDKDVSVLLLEAGGPNTNVFESKVPILFSKLFHTEHDWDYNTVEQPGLAYRRLYWPRGKMLGGSTSINAMMYHHCSKSDFDEWSSVHGCQGWGYNDLAPYFRRMEKFTVNPQRPAIDPQHRGTDGEWQTGYSHLEAITEEGFLPACVDSGIPASEDINTPSGSLGVTRFQTFIDPTGKRSSMATAFLSPAVMSRPNLYVACGAHVSRVLYDRLDSNLTPAAIGVEFLTKKGGERYEVHAKREVILAGGSINTPQTLMLSGIGPADELKKHGISIVKENNAVGQNLKDHLCPSGIICKAKPSATLDYLENTVKAIPSLLRWLVTGKGPLSSNAAEAAAFIRTVDHKFIGGSEENKPKDYGSGNIGPDIEILGAPLAFIHHGEEPALPGAGVFSIGPVGLRPQSKGTITLKSDDPFAHRKLPRHSFSSYLLEPSNLTTQNQAIIDPRYLSDEDGNDRKVLLAAFRVCFKIARHPALQKFFEPVEPNDDPSHYWWPYSSSDIDSIPDEQLIPFMKEKAFTLYHLVGTARMGPSDENSVVDLECRVHGVDRLRVVDASIFPEQVSGHPTAPIGAIAYKMSEAIQKRHCAAKPKQANL